MISSLKVTLTTLVLLFAVHVPAAEESQPLSEEAAGILASIQEEFKLTNISDETRRMISSQFDFALKEGWYSWWIGNEDLNNSRFKNDKVRVYDLIVANNNRINNITFTYFPDANQILYVKKQYVGGDSAMVFDRFNEYKTLAEVEVKKETGNFAFTKRKGFLDFDIFHIKGQEAMISYIDGGLIEIR